MEEQGQFLSNLQTRINQFRVRLDLAGKSQELANLESEVADPDLWSDPNHAQVTMRRLGEVRGELALWNGLSQRVNDLLELYQLAAAENEVETLEDLTREASQLAEELDHLEFRLVLGGPHDRDDAILAVHAGAGGTESQDWAQMLLRMYTRWAERQGFRAEVLDLSPGEEAGIKSATLAISGAFAYGYLKSERGVHRLVRLSPYDAAHRRHTSFALIEVLPDLQDDVEITVNPDDVRLDVFRSSGAGGQNVQKTSTAVRLTHVPTGTVVTCQNERSQIQNRELAFRILRARLYDMEQAKKDEERLRLKGEHVAAGWGNQIRSYVLHPYNMVKDHRTSHETSNTGAVLDGDLLLFIESYLRSQIGEDA
ncbi:MAG: peptide chain release factor 2 [Chloroflexota bacterium]